MTILKKIKVRNPFLSFSRYLTNSKAFESATVTNKTKAPSSGEIEKHDETGSPQAFCEKTQRI
jgi:hypothetical protein